MATGTIPFPAPASPEVDAGVAGVGVVQADAAEIERLREAPEPIEGCEALSRALRHADEQTVAGLTAVSRAVRDGKLAGTSFEEWGVLAAPHYLGRTAGAAAFEKFRRKGPGVISPNVVVQHSLHSLSGAISVAMGMRGPNFGVGGGPTALTEGLFTALTFLHGDMPGLWLATTQWRPEPRLDEGGSVVNGPCVCHAVALALTAAKGGLLRLRLAMPRGLSRDGDSSQPDECATLSTVADLAEALIAPPSPPFARRIRLATGGASWELILTAPQRLTRAA